MSLTFARKYFHIQSTKILFLRPKCGIIFVNCQKWKFFQYCSPFGYCSSNFAIAKVVALINFVDWFMASFLYCIYNFTRDNREKSNIAIAILEIEQLDGTIIISYFGGSNDIFADCKWLLEYITLKLSLYLDMLQDGLQQYICPNW